RRCWMRSFGRSLPGSNRPLWTKGVAPRTGTVLYTCRCSTSFLALHHVGMLQLLITSAMSPLASALGLGKATQQAWCGAQHQACAVEGLCRVVFDGNAILVDTRLQ